MKFQSKIILSGQDQLINKVIGFFTAKVLNPKLYQDILEYRQKHAEMLMKDNPNFKLCSQLGYFCVLDFLMFEGDYAQKNGIGIGVVEEVVERLKNAGILNAIPFLSPVQNFKIYSTNEFLTKFLAERNSLDNALFDFSYIAKKYSNSVFKIAVIDEKGDHRIGSGFLIARNAGVNTEPPAIVTNKHVAQFQKDLRVLDQSNKILPHKRVTLAKDEDMALIELDNDPGCPPLHFFPDESVLEEIITLGFPNVAMAKDSYQLVHRGEINSIINDYNGKKLILFSAKTAPGNSGGPLLNHMGMVVGMVAEDLFYKEALVEKGQLPYHAAIPASEIQRWILAPNSFKT